MTAAEEVGLCLSLHVACLDDVLYHAVLEGMVREDAEPSAWSEQSDGCPKHLAQGEHLAVDLNAKCLKDTGQVLLLAVAF